MRRIQDCDWCIVLRINLKNFSLPMALIRGMGRVPSVIPAPSMTLVLSWLALVETGPGLRLEWFPLWCRCIQPERLKSGSRVF